MIHADMDMDMDSQFAVFLKFPRKFSEYGASFVYLVLCAALRCPSRTNHKTCAHSCLLVNLSGFSRP
jgi:hypothetical protein